MLRARRPLIFTRPAERLANDTKNSIEMGANALWLEGFARFGKTFGARQLVQSTRWRPFPMYIAEYSYTRPTKPGEGYFASGLLEQHGQRVAKTTLSVQTMMRYTRMLREQAQGRSAEVIALIFNEANRFTLDEYEHLLTIDNELEKYVRTFHNLMCRAIATVASNLALKLPPHTLTDREMRLFLADIGIDVPKGFEPANREYLGSISMLPPTRAAGQQYLNLTCLHPSAYRAASRLVDVAINNSLVMGHHGQVSPDEARFVLQVCRAILCRGYAEGLRSVLSRHVPELYGMPRDRPHLSQPWVTAILENSDLSAICVVWRPIARGKSGEADVLDQADAANLRRQRASARRRIRKRP